MGHFPTNASLYFPCSFLCFSSQGFLGLTWAKWKRVLLTRSIAMVPCVILAVVATRSLDFLDEFINVEQSLLVRIYI